MTRRRFMTAAAAAGAGVLLYANGLARHALEITHRTIQIRNLPPAFDGFRLAQFSDIHLEEFTEDYFLREVVAQVNALKADLVVVTGDFVSHGPMPVSLSYQAAARAAEILAGLTCPRRYAIFGNHDAAVGPRMIRDHLEANGLPMLVDEFMRIERGGDYFYLVGLNDMWFQPRLSRAIPPNPDAPVILLVHEPDFSVEIARNPLGKVVDLILSGHTHGGQVRLPGLPPLALPPNGKLYPEGHYVVGTSQLYVNRGIGTVGLPFRLNCRPEITEITLRPMAAGKASALNL
jgi:predicted MPP superfamily phosphohydrolase